MKQRSLLNRPTGVISPEKTQVNTEYGGNERLMRWIFNCLKNGSETGEFNAVGEATC